MDRKLGSGERGGGRGPEPGSFVDQPGLHPRLLQRSFVLPPARLERRAGTADFWRPCRGCGRRGGPCEAKRAERGEGRREGGERRGEWGRRASSSRSKPIRYSAHWLSTEPAHTDSHGVGSPWPSAPAGHRKTLDASASFTHSGAARRRTSSALPGCRPD